MSQNILLLGASSGLGHALSLSLLRPGDTVWLVSRTRPPSMDVEDGVDRKWVGADLSLPASVSTISRVVQSLPLHCMIYAAARWDEAPTDKLTDAEIYETFAVNVAGFVALAVRLADNLAAGNATVIAIGSTAGLENSTGIHVPYSASKFALRGAVYSLREMFRSTGVKVTVFSIGGLAEEPENSADPTAELKRIPPSDVVAVIRCLHELSSSSRIKEIVWPGADDEGV